MKSRINILRSLVNGEEVDCGDNQDIEEFYNQVREENRGIQFIYEGEDSFLTIFVDILNHHTGGESYTIDRLIEIIRSEIGENFVASRQQLYIHAEILARRFNLTLIFQDLEGEIITIGDVNMVQPTNQINLFQIDDGFVYLGRNEPLVVIENIPIIDIPNGEYFGDENETVLTFAANPLYREILEAADYRLFRNPEPVGLESQIYTNIMQGFAPPASASLIDVQTDAEQWHPEWQLIPHDPNMYNIDHILAAHNPQNDPGMYASAEGVPINAQADAEQWHSEWQIIPHDPNMYNIDHILAAHNPQNDFPIGYQGTILPSFNGIFSNMNTNEIFAFFVLVGIAFYIGNEYNLIGACG